MLVEINNKTLKIILKDSFKEEHLKEFDKILKQKINNELNFVEINLENIKNIDSFSLQYLYFFKNYLINDKKILLDNIKIIKSNNIKNFENLIGLIL